MIILQVSDQGLGFGPYLGRRPALEIRHYGTNACDQISGNLSRYRQVSAAHNDIAQGRDEFMFRQKRNFAC